MNQASLLFHSGPLAGKGKKIKGDLTVIGRSSSCDISISDASISREHAKIVLENGQYIVRDLGSHNGIKVDGEGRVEALTLLNGTKFRLGTIEIEFWDGSSAPVAVASPTNEVAHTVEGGAIEVVDQGEGDQHGVSSDLEALKHKRIMNIIILIAIVSMVLLLIGGVAYMMSHKERPVHVKFLKMYTDENRFVDLRFVPMGESEQFLQPFYVDDFTSYSTEFQNITLGEDIFIIREDKIENPVISGALLLRTKMKSGSGKIFFYIGSNEERKLIGILDIEVLRRPVPELFSKYINAELETKVTVANDLYQQVLKYEADPSKNTEVWNLLRNGKMIFEDGGAKPDIYIKIEEKLFSFNKEIDKHNKQLYDEFEINKKYSDYAACIHTLNKVILVNPDVENLYRQKAEIYKRRLQSILKRVQQ